MTKDIIIIIIIIVSHSGRVWENTKPPNTVLHTIPSALRQYEGKANGHGK